MVIDLGQGVKIMDSTVKAEASRCLFCFDAPCKFDCPAGIDVPGFIRRLIYGDIRGADKLIRRENPLSWICGVLCPTEKLCASRCPRQLIDGAIPVGRLQAYVSAEACHNLVGMKCESSSCGSVAIVGAGPAGLSAALYLSWSGIRVDLFEAEEFAGGLITYGIRPEKVEKKRALQEIENLLLSSTISVQLKTRVSNPYELLKKYEAVYVATGLGAERWDEKISEFKNVYPATQFLKELNRTYLKGKLFKKNLGNHVLVIGGGNTAMDAAVAARLSGASYVTVVYRRSEAELPAWRHELAGAREHGVNFQFLLEPVSFRSNGGKTSKVVFRRTRLGRPGPDGRRRVLASGEPNIMIDASTVMIATGREKRTPPWLQGKKIDQGTGRVEKTRIFVGGELRHGAGLIVQAVADGKQAAREIRKVLNNEGSRIEA
jgi:NADPH-dependent glutamate synthase beta subunit-like oxidoreductase